MRRVVTRTLNVHRPGTLPDIAIVSSPRSGSTWLMEALSRQPRYKGIDEPEHKDLIDYHGCLDLRSRWNYVCLTDAEARELGDYLVDDRRTRLFGPVYPPDVLASLYTTRRVLKLIRMNALFEWIASLGFQTVYLIRHPMAQALSCISRKHDPHLDEWLAAECLTATLSGAQVDLVRRVLDSDDVLAQFVTQWCLENLTALRRSEAGSNFFVSAYELRVTNGESEARRLAERLRVSDSQRMIAATRVPSRVTDAGDAAKTAYIRQGRANHLLGSWRQNAAGRRERDMFDIVEAFEITAYRYGDDLPHWRLAEE